MPRTWAEPKAGGAARATSGSVDATVRLLPLTRRGDSESVGRMVRAWAAWAFGAEGL